MTENNKSRILSALLDDGNRTMQEVAKAAGCSRKTVYNALHEPDFLSAYKRKNAQMLIERCDVLNIRYQSAISVLVTIMFDETQPANVRIAAAGKVLAAANDAYRDTNDALSGLEMAKSWTNV